MSSRRSSRVGFQPLLVGPASAASLSIPGEPDGRPDRATVLST